MRKLFLFVIFCFFLPWNAFADNKPLRVGVLEVPPFVMHDQRGYYGIDIDLWNKIAERNHIAYVYVPLGQNVNNAESSLLNNKVDMLLGPFATTASRLENQYFTQPYTTSHISVLAKKDSEHNLFSITIINKFALYGFVAFLIVFYLYLSIFYFYEKEFHDDVPKNYFKGIAYLCFMSALKKKITPYFPSSLASKVIYILWSIVIFLFFSSITATITSIFVINATKDDFPIKTLEQLIDANKSVGVLAGSYDETIAKKLNLRVESLDSLDQAVDLLQQGKLVAVIADQFSLTSIVLSKKYVDLYFAPFTLEEIKFGFVFKQDSPLIKPINIEILKMHESGESENICSHYLSGVIGFTDCKRY